MSVDLSPVLRGSLYQGGHPPVGDALRLKGIDVLVLTAKEYQPAARLFPGVEVWHYPLDDDFDAPMDPRSLAMAMEAGTRVARALAGERKVAVTCWMGWNRSGLVSAIALTELGLSSKRAIDLVRRARGKNALGNPHFVASIRTIA